VIETIKRAEDGNGVIVRFYESQRCRGQVTVETGFPLSEVWRTNLLEENQTALTPEANRVRLFVRPFEIVTLRLVPTENK
jgi:alpha-mannosidase